MGIWTGTDQEAEEIVQKVFEKEYEKLVRCAASYLAGEGSGRHKLGRAEDAVQELFALVWERRVDVLSSDKPVGWMYKALWYMAKDVEREDIKWAERLERYEKFYDEPAEPDTSWELELEKLVSKEDFNLLYSFYVMGYSYRELCEKTGLTKAALGVKIWRIKRKIKEKLKE